MCARAGKRLRPFTHLSVSLVCEGWLFGCPSVSFLDEAVAAAASMKSKTVYPCRIVVPTSYMFRSSTNMSGKQQQQPQTRLVEFVPDRLIWHWLGKVWNGDSIRSAAAAAGCLDGDDSAYVRIASSKQQTNTMSYWLTDIFFKVEVINHIFNYSDKRLRAASSRSVGGWAGAEMSDRRARAFMRGYSRTDGISPCSMWKLVARADGRKDKCERR